MNADLFKAANKIWKKLSDGPVESHSKFELEVYRKLLNVFMAGDYYYYVFNVREGGFDFISDEMSELLGYPPEQLTVAFFVNKIHPDDQPWFLQFEQKVVDFFSTLHTDQYPNYKIRYDYRVRKKDGTYIRILQQVVTIQQGVDGAVFRTLGVHTDISHLKSEGAPVLSFIGLNGEPSFYNVQIDKQFRYNISGLTEREYEILNLIAAGKNSGEISELCFISKQTVDTHRKNILRKTECANSAELVSFAIKNGWI